MIQANGLNLSSLLRAGNTSVSPVVKRQDCLFVNEIENRGIQCSRARGVAVTGLETILLRHSEEVLKCPLCHDFDLIREQMAM